MEPWLSQLCASNHRADATSEHLRRCHSCLSIVRQAIMLTPPSSISDDDTEVSASRVKPSC
ncbi:hypothetical protein OAO87_04775 [bacterium]|nr:hypothetical protein [bacterium]